MICSRCKEEKSYEDFGRRGKYRQTYCKSCHNDYQKNYNFIQKYGLTREQTEQMKKAGCAACGDPATDTDHNHVTGKVRDVLCGPCNRAYGHAKEDPRRLRLLAEYAEVWHAQSAL